jgi:putative transposase
LNELKNRGVEGVLIAVVGGLKGFPDAITAVFPQAMVQTCVVHLLRHSLDFVSWKDRKPGAAFIVHLQRTNPSALILVPKLRLLYPADFGLVSLG